MAARPVELSMLDMSVIRPSVVPADENHTSAQKTAAASGISTAGASRGKTGGPALLEFSKLRGKARLTALDNLEEVISSIPNFEDERAKAVAVMQKRAAAISRILEIFGDDANHLPLTALGDFEALATNPEPFVDAAEAALNDFTNRSPDMRDNVLPETQRKRLKTSASLNRHTSTKRSLASTKAASKSGGSTLKSNTNAKSATTPLKKQSTLATKKKAK